MQNDDYENRILLLVTGLSPQVVTETVYALAVKREPRWVPTEVHVLSTIEGRERARKELLSNGWFARLLKDYNLPPIAFGEDQLHQVKGEDGTDLNDIRTEADSQAVGDALARLVTRLTSVEDSELHVSIAGGRKTMGFLAGYTLSLLGRGQDRLSHVLVSEGFESLPSFFYPTPYSRIIHTHPPENRPLDTKDADVNLADIPFVRLRTYLKNNISQKEPGYARLVSSVQEGLGGLHVEIDMDNRFIRAAGQVVKLPPTYCALYALLAKRRQLKQTGISRASIETPNKELGKEFVEVAGVCLETNEYLEFPEQGITRKQLEPWKSKLNSLLREQLGQTAAEPYLIETQKSRYTLSGLESDQIHFTEIDA